MPEPVPRRRVLRRLVVAGAILVVVVLGCLAVALFLLYREVMDYTAAAPIERPVVRTSPDEYRELLGRWSVADGAARRDLEGTPVTYDQRELNALISGGPDARDRRFAGKVAVHVEGARLLVDLSVPLRDVPLVSDRFFNGRAEVSLGVEGGRLRPEIVSLRTEDGRLVPDLHLEAIRAGLRRALERLDADRDLRARAVEVGSGRVTVYR